MEEMLDKHMKHINKNLEQILRLLKAKNRLNGETIYDNQDLCIMLKLSSRTLQRYRSSGIIPYVQIAGKPFYLESDVEEFLRKNKHKQPPSD